MVRTKQQRRRNRKLADKAVIADQALALVTGVVAGAGQITVTFNTPVQIDPDNLPSTWTFGTTPRHITAVNNATPTVINFEVSGTIAAAGPYIIGGYDPAARTPTGGYVGASAGSLT